MYHTSCSTDLETDEEEEEMTAEEVEAAAEVAIFALFTKIVLLSPSPPLFQRIESSDGKYREHYATTLCRWKRK